MAGKQRQPIGIELAKRNLITENDINKALEYKKEHPEKKLADIINILGLCDDQKLIEAMGEILDARTILLNVNDIKINPKDYISLDIMKKNKVIPFDVEAGKIKVCFADNTNRRIIETVRLLLLNKGLVMIE